MLYHKCGQRLEELENGWKEDYICPGCAEVVKPYHDHIFDTGSIEYVLEDHIEFAN
jgi:hypothetical protein